MVLSTLGTLGGEQALPSLTGADILDAVRRGDLPRPAAADLLDLGLEVVEDGRTVFRFVPDDRFDNGGGATHGGLLATVVDFAGVTALRTVLPADARVVTTNLNVSYVRPVLVSSGPLRCEGRVTHAGRRTGLAEAAITDAEGRLYVRATVSCQITLPSPAPA